MFSVQSITASGIYAHFAKFSIEVVVKMPAKEWAKHKKKGHLGQLYGIDFGNFIYAMNRNIPAHNPTVDHSFRAKKGVKTIFLTYYLNDMAKAEALGLKFKLLKNGEVLPDTSYVRIA